MRAEPVFMIQMPVAELARMIQEAVDSSLDVRFEPLRRQFEDRTLTAQEVAEKLGVTRQTLVNLEKRGKLIPKRVGSRVRYLESTITTYLADKEQ